MILDKLRTASLLSVALLIATGPSISANIPAIQADFPHVAPSQVSLVATIPSLFVILGVLIANRLELRIGKKNTILLGLLLVFLAGMTPTIRSDGFTWLFVSRCVFGIGIGLFNRLIIQMISDIYANDPAKRAKLIGWESSFEGLGGVGLTLLVGQLLQINWHTSFYAYGIALPILILFLLFVPRDRVDRAVNVKSHTEEVASPRNREAYRQVFSLSLLLFLIVMIFIFYNIQITPLLLEKGIGDATDGSTLIAFIGIGVFIAGFMFGRLYLLLDQFIMPSAIALLGLFLYLCSQSEDLWLTLLCSIGIGFSFRCIMPYLIHIFTSKGAQIAKLGTTMVLVSYNIGATLSPYEGHLVSIVLGTSRVQTLLVANSLLVLALAISVGIWLVLTRKRN